MGRRRGTVMGVEIGVELIEKDHLLAEGGFVGDLGPPHAEERSVVERGELPGKSGIRTKCCCATITPFSTM